MDINTEDLNNLTSMIVCENSCKTEKNSSYLLMKQKMWKTHDLIKQYSEKVKENASLKSDLEVTKKEVLHITSKYNSAMDQIAELRHAFLDIKEKNKNLKLQEDQYNTNIAANEKTIKQLNCRLKEIDEEYGSKIMEYDLQKSDLEDKVKSLECDLKKSKLLLKKKEQKVTSINSNTTKLVDTTIKSTRDVGINVSLCDSELNIKPKVQDKSIMTDEFYNIKDNPYPLFCSKCETCLSPTVTPEKICRVMNTFPKLIDRNLSPKKVLPSYVSYDTYTDSTNKCKDVNPFELSTSFSRSYNNSGVAHLKSELSHLFEKTQSSESELKRTNICAVNVPVATNISTNHCYNSAKLNNSPENIDYMKKYSFTDSKIDNLLTQHASSFKKMQRKLKSIEKKMKKLRKSQKKQRTSSCHHCVTNSASINSELLSSIFKCVAQCYDERRENEQKMKSEQCRKNTAEKIQLKKIKLSDAYNVSKNPFWSQGNNLEEEASTQEEDTSTQEEDISIQAKDTPIQKEDIPMQKGDGCMQKKDIMQEEDTPMQEECIPVQKESTPMQKKGISMQEKDISIQKENIQKENLCIQKESTHIQIEDTQEEDILMQEDTALQEENTSMQERDILLQEEDTFTSEEDTSTQEQSIFIPERVIFIQDAVEEEDIFIQEGIPIQEDNLPIQDDNDSSVQEEDTVIKEKDTPIQEKDASAQETEKDSMQDTIDNKFEEVITKTDILYQSYINKSTSTLNANASNVSFNSTDQSDEEALVGACRKHVCISAEKESLEDSERKSHSSNDEIYTSNNLFSNESDVESVKLEAIMKTTCLSSNDDNKNYDKRSINHATLDKKIYTITEKNNMQRKNQKEKLNSRLLKNIRNLKRKSRNSCTNKQENIVLRPNYSTEHDELAKKLQVKNQDETNNRTKQIRTLKRSMETRAVPSCTNVQEDSIKESGTESYSEPPKKRIAHVPKALAVPQLRVNQQQDLTHTIKNMANLEVFRQKCDKLQQLGAPIQKNSLLIKNKEANAINENNEKNSVECTKARSIGQESTSEKCQDNFSVPVRTISSFNKRDDVSVKHEIDKNVSIERDTMRTLIKCEEAEVKTVELTKVMAPVVGMHSYSRNTIKDKRSDDRETLKNMNMNNELTSSRLALWKVMHYKGHDCDNISKIQHLPFRNSASVADDCVDDNNTKESLDEVRSTIGTREKASISNEITRIQTIETRIEDTDKRDEKIKSTSDHREDVNDVENSQAPMFLLMEYVKKQTNPKQTKIPNKNMTYIRKLTDKFVKMQLVKLRDSPWENSVHCDIIQKLNNTCGPRIIAKCIVEFLLENVDYEKSLDKSFTPPAPLMTAFEQKIIALLVDLEASKPKTIHFVQAAIEYKLFRLSNEIKKQVETLTRIYVALSRIQKDREKVRIMCCNALYCLGVKSINVLYTILTSWPEVLPNAKTNEEILPKCIAFLIDSQYAVEMNKLKALKSLIWAFYEYSFSTTTVNDIVAEFMNALKAKKTDGLETAIILVAKKKKPSWTYTDIIHSNLLPMIIKQELPCVYSAFSLLGKLMRPFPLEDKDHVVQNIIEQLHDLIQSGQGSDDQQEGIISALLSLSRHKFDTVAQCVVKWRPNKSLRPATVTQLEGFINTRSVKFWKQYLENKKKKKINNKK